MNINRSIAILFITTVATVFGTFDTATAQTRVAIVDIGEVFKNHPQFSQRLEALKQQADQFKQRSIQDRQGLVQQAEALRAYKPGSPNYVAEETRLAQASAKMEVEQKEKMRSLMLEEAQLHHQTYQQVKKVIAGYCESQGIKLVLRYNGQPMELGNPASVMQRVNSSVVFHRPEKDITSIIIDQVGAARTALNPGQQP